MLFYYYKKYNYYLYYYTDYGSYILKELYPTILLSEYSFLLSRSERNDRDGTW